MKKLILVSIAATTAFTVRTFFAADAARLSNIQTLPSLATDNQELPSFQAAVAQTPITTTGSSVQVPPTSALSAPIAEPLSFTALQRLNEAVDSENLTMQPYYIQAFMLPEVGTYFAATNVSTDTLTAGTAVVGSLEAEDGATIEGSLSAESIHAERITAPRGITFYDSATNNPYCFGIANGAADIQAGTCAVE